MRFNINKVFASGQAICEASLTVLRPTERGSETSRTQKHSLCELAANSGALNPQGNKKKFSFVFVVVGIYLVSLGVRVFKLIVDPILLRDSAAYLAISEQWFESKSYLQIITEGFVFPPLPCYSIVKLMEMGFSSEIAGRSLSLFLGSLIPVLVYIYISTISKKTVIRIIFVSIIVLHPSFIAYSIQPLRENYYLFFLAISIIAATKAIKYKRALEWGMCGIATAIAFFCRYEALELLIIYPTIIFILFLKRAICLKKTLGYISLFFISNVILFFVLLSITNYNLSFLYKVSDFSNRFSEENYIKDIFGDEDIKVSQ